MAYEFPFMFCIVYEMPCASLYVLVAAISPLLSKNCCPHSCCFIFWLVPEAPPNNMRAHNTNSTSILIQWDQVPKSKQHGEILSYTVFYWETEGSAQGASHRQLSSSKRELRLTDLFKYTYYNNRVLASTAVGNGPASGPIQVRTDEDSKYILTFNRYCSDG